MKPSVKRLTLLLALLPSLLFGAANDLRISQKNATDTAWLDRIFNTGNNRVLITNGSGVPGLTAAGTEGQVLTISSGAVAFAAPPTGTLPSQTGKSGYWLTTDGTNAAWGLGDFVSKPTRPGLISAGASPVGTTQDNAGLAFGTGDLTIGAWVRLPDWTPAAEQIIVNKQNGLVGVTMRIRAAAPGVLRVSLGNGASMTHYDSPSAVGISDGAWAFISATLDRAGNLTTYLNGAQFSQTSIAALSAQTLTITTALNWFSDGTSFAAGTLGETWIISGLLTATQIADIYRAGSIAPFCSFAANTTTGQNTATIGGLSFFQWADFGQGYGPIIRDRSGNNQHALMGTSGLTHALPLSPRGNPSRAPMKALVGDGSNGSFVRSTLNTQNPGTGEFTLAADLVAPAADATQRSWAGLSPTADVFSSRCLFIGTSLSGSTIVRLTGASAGDQRLLTVSALPALLANKRATVWVRRNSSGVRLFLGVDGDVFDITHLATESVNGSTPPAWTDQVDGQFASAFFGNAASSVAGTLYDLRLANVAMTEAQLRAEYERGEPGPEWVGATKTANNTSTAINGSGTAAYDTFSGASATGFSVTKTGTTNGAIAMTQPTFAVRSGQRFRVTWTHTQNSGTLPTVALQSGTTVQFSKSNSVTAAAGANTADLVANDNGTFSVAFRNNAAETTDYSVASITVTPLGYTTRLRTDTAAGLTAINGATSTTNDSTNFVFSSTGVTTSPLLQPTLRQILGNTSTNGNQQLLGAQVQPTTGIRYDYVSVRPRTGTPTITIGNASGGSQIVSSVTLSAGVWQDLTLLTRRNTTGNVWIGSNSTDVIDIVFGVTNEQP